MHRRLAVDNLVGNVLGVVNRNGKAHARAGARIALDERVNTHKLAIVVDERAAGVARVDGGVGLHELDARVTVAERAVEGADNAARHAALELKAHRVADGDGRLADDNLVGVRKRCRRQVFGVDLDDGEVRDLIRADDLALEATAIGQRDDELLGAVDDVVVRDDVAVTLEDDARADALRLDRVVEPVARDGLVGDADDSRADSLGRVHGRRVARTRDAIRRGLCRSARRSGRAAGVRDGRDDKGSRDEHGEAFMVLVAEIRNNALHFEIPPLPSKTSKDNN